MEKPPSLAELQAQFQAAVLRGERGVLGFVPASSKADRETLLGVYIRGYGARLLGVLRSDHPVLCSYLGEVRFAALVAGYLAKHPSRSASVRWVSDAFPAYLRETVPEAGELGEIAEIERTLNLAFDAADASVLDLAGLAALAPPEQWGALAITPHPSARLLTFTTSAYDIWRAVRAGEAAPPAQLLEVPQHVLVSRGAEGVVQRPVQAGEAMMWQEALRGTPFGALCELAAVFDDPATAPQRAAQALAAWLQAGAIAAATLVERRTPD